MEQETPGADAEKKDKMFHAVLHTRRQNKTAKEHKKVLKKEGKNAKRIPCLDISAFESLNIGDVVSLHLIVDIYMYGILMVNGRLHDAAHEKFTELGDTERTVYVLNFFSNDFDNLYHHIPENARELWDQKQERLHKGEGSSHQQHKDYLTTFEKCEFDVGGVSGGSMKTGNTSGCVVGGMGNTNSGDVANNPDMKGMSKDCTIQGNQFHFYLGTKEEYKVDCTRIGEHDSSTVRVEQAGLQPSSQHNLIITIKSQENDQAIADAVIKNQEKLKSKEVRDVQIMNGSVIIKLTVEKNYIMTDKWVQSILMTLFYDVLGDFFTEETTFEVSVERNVCLGEEELIRLYTSQEDHSNCVPKVEFEAMKSKLEEMALQGQDCSSLNGGPQIKTETLDENKFDQEPVGENKIDDESLSEKPLEQLLETWQDSAQQRHSEDQHCAENPYLSKMSEDPSCSDSDEYHTCDEEDDDGNDDRADSGSSTSSDDGRDYYHTSDEDEDEELDVLAAAPVVSVKKETHQLYTSNITAAGGYNALVQLNVNVTQQQFGHVKATNINQSFGGKQHISKTVTFHEKKTAELRRADLIMKRTVAQFKAWNKGMVKTAALEQVLDKLESGTTWLTIKGNPGEGKTIVSYMALEELYKQGRQVFEVRSPAEFSEVISTCPRPVIMLDDMFGNYEFDQSKWSCWEPAVSTLLKEREHKSHEENDNTPKKDVTVILVGRDYVLNSVSKDLGRLSDYLESDKYVVFMGHSLQRKIDEKRAIWDSISKSSGVQLDKSVIDEIMEIRVVHGFPHVCRLFVTLYMKNKAMKAKEFFEKPFEFLNESVSNLFKDVHKLQLFKEMVNSGKIGMRELRRLDPTYKLIQAAKSLVGSYLRIEDDMFVFDHPSIYDSVAFNLCSLDPVFVIQQCKLQFINERIRLQMSENSSSTVRTESSLVVFIDSSYGDELAERFSSEIKKHKFHYVLSHQAFNDGSFVRKVMSLIAVPFSKLLHLKDQTIYCRSNSFLHYVPSSQSPELLKYLDNHPDIELSDNDEKVILSGTCAHAAVHVLTYLVKTRSPLDINVRFKGSNFVKKTPLTIAAETCDIQFIQQVLSLKPDLNTGDGFGRTALHILCMNGLVSVVKQIIDNGADIDVKDIFEATPLCYACKKNEECVDVLLKAGAEVNIQNKDGDTALHEAAERGSKECVDLLLKAGADVNIQNEDGNTALYRAAGCGSEECVDMLLKAGAGVKIERKAGDTALHEAAWCGSKECVDLLLKAGADVNIQNEDGHTALHVSAERGSKECVDVLLKAGADVNIQTNDGEAALHGAAERGSKECVDLLLKADADVNIQSKAGYTALHKVAGDRSKECVDLLLKAGADVNIQKNDGDTALHGAALSGSKECVDMLLKAGAGVKIENKDGNTALHAAAGCGSEECVDVLLKAGAGVNIESKAGYTALHVAAGYGSKECADVLLKAGAGVNIESKDGYTALHVAAGYRSKECINFLLKAGAGVDMQSKDGNTALHVAAGCGSEEYVDVLLKAGAGVNIRNKDDDTALHVAAEKGFTECVNVLMKAGADVNIQNM